MKRLLLLACASLIFSCTHKDPVDKMTLVRDCTGTYLRMGGKDYHVCNTETTDLYPDGTAVTAAIKRISSCTALSDGPDCKMYHANEGWIWVSSIR